MSDIPSFNAGEVELLVSAVWIERACQISHFGKSHKVKTERSMAFYLGAQALAYLVMNFVRGDFDKFAVLMHEIRRFLDAHMEQPHTHELVQ